MPYFDDYAGFDESMKEETPPAPAPAPQPSCRSDVARTAFDYIELLVLTVFFVLLATTFLFRHAVVNGDSMKTTLTHGEHLIISDVLYSPERGDIVVLESYEETHINTPIIKRVIATEGETVEVRRDGIYIDGTFLEESYAYFSDNSTYINYFAYAYSGGYLPSALNEEGTAYIYHVGENEVFVLGDNRFNSTDSRVFGPVSEDCILGKVVLRLTPFDRFGGVD